ncbi:MAG: GntR family transcriptional regulator [Synergistaceae bacterium]|nr:GntR family transcriptional regulator [Synergistaceae bacterium]
MNGSRHNEKHGSKASQAYEALKALLVGGMIEKDKIIPTSVLADRVKLADGRPMGYAPMLDALKRLEAERYVMIIPQKGVIVRDMTVKDMRDINDVRIALEGFTMTAIAPGFTGEDAAFLDGQLREQRAAELEDNPKRFIKSDEVFHMYLCEKSENHLIIDITRRLRERFFMVGLFILEQPARMHSTLEEHQAIMDALTARDPEAAKDAMVRHLQNGKSRL